MDIFECVKSLTARVDRVETTRIDSNLKTIVARMNSMESNLKGISELLRTTHNSRLQPCSTHSPETNQENLKSMLHDPLKEDTTSTDQKDLLRRLNRGHLLQFDELSDEETEGPVHTASLMEVLKFEVC